MILTYLHKINVVAKRSSSIITLSELITLSCNKLHKQGVLLNLINNFTYSARRFESEYIGSENNDRSSTNETHSNAESEVSNMLLRTIEIDLSNNEKECTKLIKKFIMAISANTYKHNNETVLISTLTLLSKYTHCSLPKPILMKIYQIIGHNIHLKSEETLNELLRFVLKCDNGPYLSPIFFEFIKFYVRMPLETIKVRFNVDFSNQTIIEGIKSLLVGILQRGYLSKTPPYKRELTVTKGLETLELLLRNKQAKSSLMVRKIFEGLFEEIRSFYIYEMSENLYHEKRWQLLVKLQPMVWVLSLSVPMIEHEVKYLRELFIKLYLSSEVCVMEHILKKQWHKVSCVVNFYGLCCEEVAKMRREKDREEEMRKEKGGESRESGWIEENMEIIGLLEEFVDKVESNFKDIEINLERKDEVSKLIIEIVQNFTIEETILILGTKKLCRISETSKSNKLAMVCVDRLTKMSALAFHIYFSDILSLHCYLQSNSCDLLLSMLLKFDYYHELNFSQLKQLIIVFKNKEYCTNNSLVIFNNIFDRILSIEDNQFNETDILVLLQIDSETCEFEDNQTNEKVLELYHEFLIMIKNKRKTLQIFLLRYIADHHRELSLSTYEEILYELLRTEMEDYNDEENNYPKSIFEELKEYNMEIGDKLKKEIRDALHKHIENGL